MTVDLEATQEIPVTPKSNVAEFTGTPYRVTAESVVRHLLSKIDQIEDVAVVFRLKGKTTLLMNYSSDMHGLDLAIGGMTLTELAKNRLGLLESTEDNR